jgi:hypothetical protein
MYKLELEHTKKFIGLLSIGVLMDELVQKPQVLNLHHLLLLPPPSCCLHFPAYLHPHILNSLLLFLHLP